MDKHNKSLSKKTSNKRENKHAPTAQELLRHNEPYRDKPSLSKANASDAKGIGRPLDATKKEDRSMRSKRNTQREYSIKIGDPISITGTSSEILKGIKDYLSALADNKKSGEFIFSAIACRPSS